MPGLALTGFFLLIGRFALPQKFVHCQSLHSITKKSFFERPTCSEKHLLQPKGQRVQSRRWFLQATYIPTYAIKSTSRMCNLVSFDYGAFLELLVGAESS